MRSEQLLLTFYALLAVVIQGATAALELLSEQTTNQEVEGKTHSRF
jgi:hypothetical protein